MTLKALIAVASGGALGALARYALTLALPRVPSGFPTAHFLANVAGSVLIGVLYASLLARGDAPTLRLFMVTGVLGAFTTYSAFSLDVVELAERGQAAMALAYVLATVVACVAGCGAGALVARLAIR